MTPNLRRNPRSKLWKVRPNRPQSSHEKKNVWKNIFLLFKIETFKISTFRKIKIYVIKMSGRCPKNSKCGMRSKFRGYRKIWICGNLLTCDYRQFFSSWKFLKNFYKMRLFKHDPSWDVQSRSINLKTPKIKVFICNENIYSLTLNETQILKYSRISKIHQEIHFFASNGKF